jgi:hypothetical protein
MENTLNDEHLNHLLVALLLSHLELLCAAQPKVILLNRPK